MVWHRLLSLMGLPASVHRALRAKFGFSGILSLEKQLTPVTTDGRDRGGCVTAEAAYRDSGQSMGCRLTPDTEWHILFTYILKHSIKVAKAITELEIRLSRPSGGLREAEKLLSRPMWVLFLIFPWSYDIKTTWEKNNSFLAMAECGDIKFRPDGCGFEAKGMCLCRLERK